MGRLRCVAAAMALAVAVSAVAAGPTLAKGGNSATTTVKQELVGTWDLVSFVLLDEQNTVVAYPYGQPPSGRLTYTADGQVWALVGPTGPPMADLPSTWYTGTFRVDVKRKLVIHRVAYSSMADWVGTDLLRRYKFAGPRRLTLSTLPTGAEGVRTHGVLKWIKSR
jgi:hypothetical protein